jgi:hypothetical protein
MAGETLTDSVLTSEAECQLPHTHLSLKQHLQHIFVDRYDAPLIRPFPVAAHHFFSISSQ